MIMGGKLLFEKGHCPSGYSTEDYDSPIPRIPNEAFGNSLSPWLTWQTSSCEGSHCCFEFLGIVALVPTNTFTILQFQPFFIIIHLYIFPHFFSPPFSLSRSNPSVSLSSLAEVNSCTLDGWLLYSSSLLPTLTFHPSPWCFLFFFFFF